MNSGNEEMKFESMDQMVQEAEAMLQKGLSSLSALREQAREIFDKPGVALALGGISGFVAGALLRHGLAAKSRGSQRASVESVALIAGGLAAGALIGPQLIEKALTRLDQLDPADSVIGLRRGDVDAEVKSRGTRETGAMNQRPFEKS